MWLRLSGGRRAGSRAKGFRSKPPSGGFPRCSRIRSRVESRGMKHEQNQRLQQRAKKDVVGVEENDRVSRKSGGPFMLVNVDIVTAFDQATGHRSRYVLWSEEEPTTKQISLQDGTGVASAICLRLIESGRADDLHAAVRRSFEEPGAPQRIGSIEFDDQRNRTQ